MWILILSLIILGSFAYGASSISFQSKKRRDKIGEKSQEEKTSCNHDECVYKTICTAKVAAKKIEYFDDEELDIYKGKKPDSYTNEQIEHFREILYTIDKKEISDWVRSLQLRHINLPYEIKNRISIITEEKHNTNSKKG